MNKKDRQILYELDLNARIPLTELAKKVALSPQTTKYRIEQLEKNKLIKKYVTFFDAAKLGYLYYRFYVRFENTSSDEEYQIIEYLKNHSHVIWFISTSGKWDLEVLFAARNFIHYNNMLKDFYKEFPDKLTNNITSVSIANYHQRRGYLLNKKTEVQLSYGGEPIKKEIDKIDKKMMEILNQNSRLNASEVGEQLGLNYKTIQYRLKRLEEKGIIQAFRTWIDFKKIGYVYHKAMFKLKNFSDKEEKKILQFCKQNKNVMYVITCVWPWNVEIEVQAESEETFLKIVKEFRNLMEHTVIDFDTLTITEEHKLNYLPFIEEI